MHYRVSIFYVFTVFLLIDFVYCSSFHVDLTSNGPVVLGASIQFNAHLYKSDGSIPTGKFKYVWEDSSLQNNRKEIILNSPSCFLNMTYDSKVYPPGPYTMQVEVYDLAAFIPWFADTSARLIFELTTLLNGKIQLTQGSQVQSGIYVASGTTTRQEVVLSNPDYVYLNKSATSIRTLWFLDCQLIANVSDYNITTNFSKPEEQHTLQAIVVADFEPIPVPPPPTPITTTTTTPKPPKADEHIPVVNATPRLLTKRAASNSFSSILNISSPFVCNNSNLIQPNPNLTYGFFERNITVKAPIVNVSILGNNWLRHGEVLQLNVSCQGSSPIRYCLIFERGIQNVTGNETCTYTPSVLESCKFNIYHYFRDEEQHTIFIILDNDVTKIVKPVAVTIYKAIHHPQLSVIVVPVSFSLVAVVLIVFGVAYYVQSRHRFIVEVADFDFGEQYAEMDYKTFSQRLKEALSETFIGHSFMRYFTREAASTSTNATAAPGFKYGSMT